MRKLKRRRRRKKQLGFFNTKQALAKNEWRGMPEYVSNHEPKPKIKATFNFESEKDFKKFEDALRDHKIFDKDKKIFNRNHNRETWYPQKSRSPHFVYEGNEKLLPRFPVYIISKGRYEKRPTADMLEKMGIPYFIVVEKSEYRKYKAVVKGKVLILPQKYKNEYDKFWDDDGPTGSGPARNFVWDHSIKNGHEWHFILDDNIEVMMRFNNNLKIKCQSPAIFRAMEDFALRYENVAIAGPHYSFFIAEKSYYPPYVANTRVFSFLLIRNDIPFRWRGRYNEDVDLCLRVLKAGWCTILYNAFLQRKMATQTLSGGNTSEIYQKGTYEKSKMLVEMHPDVARMSDRYGRDHHYVDYRQFKGNKLKRKSGLKIKKGVNEFGMIRTELKRE